MIPLGHRPLWKRARREIAIVLWRASGAPLWVLLHTAGLFDPCLRRRSTIEEE